MDKDNEVIEDEIIDDAKTKEEEMNTKLSELETKVQGTEMLTSMLADPQVRMLLESKQKGKKVKVVADEPDTSTKVTVLEDDVDFEALTNKQLANHLLKLMGSNIDSAFTTKLEPITKMLGNLESYVGNNEAKSVNEQIKEVKGKYSDFDTFLPDMKELNKTSPDLNIEELYLITKRRKVNPGDQKVESERPSTSSVKVPEKKARKVPLPSGRAGFDQMIGEALDNLKLDGLG